MNLINYKYIRPFYHHFFTKTDKCCLSIAISECCWYPKPPLGLIDQSKLYWLLIMNNWCAQPLSDTCAIGSQMEGKLEVCKRRMRIRISLVTFVPLEWLSPSHQGKEGTFIYLQPIRGNLNLEQRLPLQPGANAMGFCYHPLRGVFNSSLEPSLKMKNNAT